MDASETTGGAGRGTGDLFQIDLAMDLCEFLTFRLTGQLVRSIGSLSYKCLWAEDLSFPERTFLNGLRAGFYEEYCHFLRGDVRKPGECAGMLRSELTKDGDCRSRFR